MRALINTIGPGALDMRYETLSGIEEIHKRVLRYRVETVAPDYLLIILNTVSEFGHPALDYNWPSVTDEMDN
jgi:hypothetical protein